MDARPKALTVGPHGGQNLGDELLLSCVADMLEELGYEVTASSQAPRETTVTHGLPAIEMINVKGWRLRSLRSFGDYDLIVVAGGEQIAGGRYRNPLRGHLVNVFANALGARRAATPFAIVAVGAEEIKSSMARTCLRYVLRHAAYVSCRDPESAAYLSKFSPRPIALTADPAFRVEQRDKALAKLGLERQFGPGPKLLFCPADDQRGNVDYTLEVAQGLQTVAREHGATILVKAMDHQPQFDARLLESDVFRSPEFVILPRVSFARTELIDLFAGVDHVTSARMHPLILAMTQSTSWLSINRNEKLRRFCRLVGVEGVEPADLNAKLICDKVSIQLANVNNQPSSDVLDSLRARVDRGNAGLLRSLRQLNDRL